LLNTHLPVFVNATRYIFYFCFVLIVQ